MRTTSSSEGGRVLRAAREHAGLTRAELAGLVGCSLAQLANIEWGAVPRRSAVLDRAWSELVEQIARRAAELVAERQAAAVSPWLNAESAAAYIDAPVGRIHDLVQLRKLTPHRDGRRLLFRRESLDRYLEDSQ